MKYVPKWPQACGPTRYRLLKYPHASDLNLVCIYSLRSHRDYTQSPSYIPDTAPGERGKDNYQCPTNNEQNAQWPTSYGRAEKKSAWHFSLPVCRSNHPSRNQVCSTKYYRSTLSVSFEVADCFPARLPKQTPQQRPGVFHQVPSTYFITVFLGC